MTNVPMAIFRFRLTTSSLGNDIGWFIDDIAVRASTVGVDEAEDRTAALSVSLAPVPSRSMPRLAILSPVSGRMKVSVTDALGREIDLRPLASEVVAGSQTLLFEGGDRLLPGTYLWRIEVGTSRSTGRFVIIP